MSDLLTAMRTLIRLYEVPSFSRVAQEMNASHTTIARRLDMVEAHFAVVLFHRSTRRLVPTGEADRLLPHARGLIESMDLAEMEMAGPNAPAKGLVRLGLTTALGLHYIQHINQLLATNPGLQIDCTMTDWQRDVVEDRLDLALRVAPIGDDTLVVHRLGLLPRQLVAHPEYVQRHGMPNRAADLVAHDCIAYAYGDLPSKWHVDGKEQVVKGVFRSDNSEAVHRAVLGGLGIALLPSIRVVQDVEEGRLVHVLPDSAIPPLEIFAAHPSHRRLSPRARLVLEFLRQNFPN